MTSTKSAFSWPARNRRRVHKMASPGAIRLGERKKSGSRICNHLLLGGHIGSDKRRHLYRRFRRRRTCYVRNRSPLLARHMGRIRANPKQVLPPSSRFARGRLRDARWSFQHRCGRPDLRRRHRDDRNGIRPARPESSLANFRSARNAGRHLGRVVLGFHSGNSSVFDSR